MFVAVEIAAFPLLLVFGRHTWFTQDDWDFLSARTAWNLGDWFRAHYQHLVMLPILAYRLLWVLFGMHTYVPYLALVIALHIASVALLRVVMRRAGVSGWLATLLAGAFVFFGAGGENILVAFQITFVGAFFFGLGQLVLADHDGPIDRRDGLGLVAGFLGLLCSGVAVAMTLVVGMAVLLRRGPRGWRVALFHTMPIGVGYVVWSVVAPKGQAADFLHSHSIVQVTKFVATGVEAAFGGLGQLPGVGIALLVLLVAGIVLAFRAEGRAAFGGRRAASTALVVGAVVFLFMTGVARAGAPGLVAQARAAGPERARESRYVYLIAAMCLPAIALGADALVRRGRLVAIPVLAILVAGIPANVHQIATYKPPYATPSGTRFAVLAVPRLPLAGQLRHSKTPYPLGRLIPEGLTLGWLVDNAESGKLPDPGTPPPGQSAALTLLYFTTPAAASPSIRCAPLRTPVKLVLERGQSITFEGGPVSVVYRPPGGAPSFPLRFQPLTYRALVGPLPLRITALDHGVSICQ